MGLKCCQQMFIGAIKECNEICKNPYTSIDAWEIEIISAASSTGSSPTSQLASPEEDWIPKTGPLTTAHSHTLPIGKSEETATMTPEISLITTAGCQKLEMWPTKPSVVGDNLSSQATLSQWEDISESEESSNGESEGHTYLEDNTVESNNPMETEQENILCEVETNGKKELDPAIVSFPPRFCCMFRNNLNSVASSSVAPPTSGGERSTIARLNEDLSFALDVPANSYPLDSNHRSDMLYLDPNLLMSSATRRRRVRDATLSPPNEMVSKIEDKGCQTSFLNAVVSTGAYDPSFFWRMQDDPRPWIGRCSKVWGSSVLNDSRIIDDPRPWVLREKSLGWALTSQYRPSRVALLEGILSDNSSV